MPTENPSKPTISQIELDESVINAFRRLNKVAVSVVYLIGGMGFALIVKSAFALVVKKFTNWTTLGNSLDDATYTAISGVELLLLAPLAYLILRSLAVYVQDLVDKDKAIRDQKHAKLAQADKRAVDAYQSGTALAPTADVPAKPEFISSGKEGLLETKALSIALLIAITATHLIGSLTSLDEKPGHSLSIVGGGIGIALLITLSLIYFGFELTTIRLKKAQLESMRDEEVK